LEKAKGEPRGSCANHLFDDGYVTLVFASKHFGRRWAAAEAFSRARGLFTPHGHQRATNGHGTARRIPEKRNRSLPRERARGRSRSGFGSGSGSGSDSGLQSHRTTTIYV